MGRGRSGADLWREHLAAPFPASLRGAEFDGVDVVLLDADIAGCVLAWLEDGGALDDERARILRACLDELDRVVPRIGDPAGRRYFARLRALAEATCGGTTGSGYQVP